MLRILPPWVTKNLTIAFLVSLPISDCISLISAAEKNVIVSFLVLVASKPSILIVDDDTVILSVFAKIFQRKGYCVTVAEKGRSAREKLRMKQYDVALIDLVLPDMQGDELFPMIKRSSPKTLKILLTGKIALRNSIKGADVFIEKPVNPGKLLSIIDTKLKNRDSEV